MSRSTLRWLAPGLLLALAPTSALGQTAQDAAAAESLFREAKALIAEGKFDEACPKFEASQRLDPGLGTLLNLADCNDKAGKTASAWAQFLDAATLARRTGATERADVASQRAQALERRLVRLRILVPAEVRTDGLEVKRDGIAIDAATWGGATPVDPGTHLVSAKATGKKEWSRAIEVMGEGQIVDLAIPKLEDAPVEATPEPSATAAPTSAPPPSKPLPAADSGGQATIGYILGAAGLVGLGVGTVFGLQAKGKWNDADCPANHCKTAADQTNAEDAKSSASISTVAFIAGGALVALGGVLVFTAGGADETPPSSVSLAPAVGPTGGGFTAFGSF